jgi:ribosomal protein S18 acetylase RimI-like enzyme
MIRLRELKAEDREVLGPLLRSTQKFTEAEIEIALELVDEAIEKTDTSYQFIIAESKEGVQGYGCWGMVPLTIGAYDIYWIAVSPESQGKGVGSQILHHMEDEIMKNQGRMILLETSSSEAYKDTRAFYEKRGYQLESRLRDFYKPGDDRCIYVKRIDPFG